MSGNYVKTFGSKITRTLLSADGSPNQTGDAERRVMRGGSYGDFAAERRSDMRRYFPKNEGNQSLGFRIAAVKVAP